MTTSVISGNPAAKSNLQVNTPKSVVQGNDPNASKVLQFQVDTVKTIVRELNEIFNPKWEQADFIESPSISPDSHKRSILISESKKHILQSKSFIMRDPIRGDSKLDTSIIKDREITIVSDAQWKIITEAANKLRSDPIVIQEKEISPALPKLQKMLKESPEKKAIFDSILAGVAAVFLNTEKLKLTELDEVKVQIISLEKKEAKDLIFTNLVKCVTFTALESRFNEIINLGLDPTKNAPIWKWNSDKIRVLQASKILG